MLLSPHTLSLRAANPLDRVGDETPQSVLRFVSCTYKLCGGDAFTTGGISGAVTKSKDSTRVRRKSRQKNGVRTRSMRSEGQLSSQELFESLLRRQKAAADAADVSTLGPEAPASDVSDEVRERVREKMQKVDVFAAEGGAVSPESEEGSRTLSDPRRQYEEREARRSARRLQGLEEYKQLAPLLLGFLAYKAGALVQTYRDNKDLLG